MSSSVPTIADFAKKDVNETLPFGRGFLPQEKQPRWKVINANSQKKTLHTSSLKTSNYVEKQLRIKKNPDEKSQNKSSITVVPIKRTHLLKKEFSLGEIFGRDAPFGMGWKSAVNPG